MEVNSNGFRPKVDGKLSTLESHKIAEQVRHDLFHALPTLVDVTVHVDPKEDRRDEHHFAGHHGDGTEK